MTTDIAIICRKCGSDDIRVDAYSSWDMKNQKWVHTSEHGNHVCEGCGGETRVTELLLPEYAEQLAKRFKDKPFDDHDLENKFFDVVRLCLKPEQWGELENYNLKATAIERIDFGLKLLGIPPSEDTANTLLREAYERWPEFADQREVDGGDMVEWFAEWWERAKAVLEKPVEPLNSNAPGA